GRDATAGRSARAPLACARVDARRRQPVRGSRGLPRARDRASALARGRRCAGSRARRGPAVRGRLRSDVASTEGRPRGGGRLRERLRRAPDPRRHAARGAHLQPPRRRQARLPRHRAALGDCPPCGAEGVVRCEIIAPSQRQEEENMALSFGVTVLPDPPYQRLVELMALGEKSGFDTGWTYDSHVLWQDSFPIPTLAIQATTTMKFGHLVTNPGTREPTVLASLYATLHDISDGRMVMGIGRGDSARRYIGQQPVRVAEFETALRMIKPFMNGEEVRWNDKDLQLKWVRSELPEIEMLVAGYGPKALAVA